MNKAIVHDDKPVAGFLHAQRNLVKQRIVSNAETKAGEKITVRVAGVLLHLDMVGDDHASQVGKHVDLLFGAGVSYSFELLHDAPHQFRIRDPAQIAVGVVQQFSQGIKLGSLFGCSMERSTKQALIPHFTPIFGVAASVTGYLVGYEGGYVEGPHLAIIGFPLPEVGGDDSHGWFRCGDLLARGHLLPSDLQGYLNGGKKLLPLATGSCS